LRICHAGFLFVERGFGTEPLLPIHTETGESRWIQSLSEKNCAPIGLLPHSGPLHTRTTSTLLEFRISDLDTSRWIRRLYLRPGLDKKAQSLVRVCSHSVSLRPCIHPLADMWLISMFQLDTSPFGEYQTWAELSQLVADAKDNLADQLFPNQSTANALLLASQQKATPSRKRAAGSDETINAWKRDTFRVQQRRKGKPVTQSSNAEFTSVFDMHVSASNMFNAAGKRRGFAGQQTVIGFSAPLPIRG